MAYKHATLVANQAIAPPDTTWAKHSGGDGGGRQGGDQYDLEMRTLPVALGLLI